jgi:LysR family glycine cleavage system transcriptional activator
MPRTLPPLNALRTFEAAARHGSYVGAAAELHVTPAAINQQVSSLERYLSARLFRRLPHGLRLTEQGRAYLPELSAGLDLLASGTARLRVAGSLRRRRTSSARR